MADFSVLIDGWRYRAQGGEKWANVAMYATQWVGSALVTSLLLRCFQPELSLAGKLGSWCASYPLLLGRYDHGSWSAKLEERGAPGLLAGIESAIALYLGMNAVQHFVDRSWSGIFPAVGAGLLGAELVYGKAYTTVKRLDLLEQANPHSPL